MKTIARAAALVALLLVVIQIGGLLFYNIDLAGQLWNSVVEIGREPAYAPISAPEDPGDEAEPYSYTEQRMGYSQLPGEPAQALYQQISQAAPQIGAEPDENGLYPVSEVVYENGRIDEAQIHMVVSAFRNENPEMFWLANRYRYGYSGDTTTLCLYSYISAEECSTMTEILNSVRSEIFSEMPQGLSELDRELYLFEALAARCSYDAETASGGENWKAYTQYGALVEGKAVCEGYSRAMQSLLSYAGMESALVSGTSKQMLHMWNLVKIDEEWYHLDATWNDGDSLVNYKYFNVTDAVIAQDHTMFRPYEDIDLETADTEDLQNANLKLPRCSSSTANYFISKAVHIQDLKGRTNPDLVAAIITAAGERKESVSVYIDEALSFDEAMDGLFSQYPFLVTYCMREASRKTGITLDSSRSVFVSDPVSRGITLKLLYEES